MTCILTGMNRTALTFCLLWAIPCLATGVVQDTVLQETLVLLDERLAGTGIYLTGNYFDGLAIEECVARSEAEFARFEQASG